MGAGRGLRVEVKSLDDERTSTPAIVKGSRAVSRHYLLLLCFAAALRSMYLLVDLEGIHRGCSAYLGIDA